MFRSLSVLTSLHQHNMRSRLCFKAGMKASRDLVGDDRRRLVQEEITKVDPFNFSRSPAAFSIKSAGSPFTSLSEAKMNKFVQSAKGNFSLNFPELCPARPHPDNKD